MRIGIEGQRLFRKKKHGMDMVALELIRNLQILDTKNEYFVFVKEDEDECLLSGGNFELVKLRDSPYPVWEQFVLPSAAKKANCDILHCTSNTAPLSTSIPLVVTLHDIIYMEKLSLLSKGFTNYQKFGNLYRRMVVPGVVRKCKKLITVSEFEKQRIADFSDEKIPLVMLDYDREALAKLIEEVGDPSLHDHIILTGYVPNTELPGIYSLSTLFLYPSLRESFGIPMLEAMACGTPVITSNTSSMPEVAGNAALFIDPFKPEKITESMFRLLSDTALRAGLIASGLERAKKFTWKNMTLGVLQVYNEIMSNK
ncbi:MAG: glycosyltransferase family 1 protein [Bacteroidetes bacterium]|nr:glycosyltransferase family 1 protein [Bacteroidota bacterium]